MMSTDSSRRASGICWFFFFKQKTAYEIMPSLVGSEMCIRDSLHADHLAGLTMRNLERGVPHFPRLLAEYGPQELLLRGELGLTLGGHFPHEDISRLDLRPDAYGPVLIQVFEYLLLDVWDIRSYLLVSELRAAGFYLVLLDMNRREQVFVLSLIH